MKNIDWFKQNIAPLLRDYDVEYRSFKDGDFGNLERVEFNSPSKLCSVRFWSSGVLEIDVVNAETVDSIMNYFMFENELEEQEKRLEELIELLKKDLKEDLNPNSGVLRERK